VARPDLDAVARQQATDVIRTASPAFRRVGVLDDRAIVTAYSPLLDSQGRTVLGRDFSDRPYIHVIRSTLRPHVADLAMGRIGRPEPIFPLVVPILRNGQYDGYCIGITDTDLVWELLQTIAGQGNGQLTLLDRKGLVVSSTRTDLPVMAAFQPMEGEARALGEGSGTGYPGPGSARAACSDGATRWSSVRASSARISPGRWWWSCPSPPSSTP
jgi:hypothetical protein